jgi:hypothetical protein
MDTEAHYTIKATNMDKILGYGAIALATIALIVNFSGGSAELGGISDASCSVSSTETVTIGDDVSVQVLAAASNRAYARITALDGEANTISLSFDEGAAAVDNQGALLHDASYYIEVGRNTDLPYTGAVTAITDTSSTTVAVTDCLY